LRYGAYSQAAILNLDFVMHERLKPFAPLSMPGVVVTNVAQTLKSVAMANVARQVKCAAIFARIHAKESEIAL
jgi:hypothetical protein